MARLGGGIGLVGRRGELSALAATLERARVGRPGGVLLSGDAGVGKSRLVREAVQRGAATGFTVLVGRCLDTAESSLPYLPFTEIVGGLAARQPDLVAARPALRHLLPGGLPRANDRSEDRDLGQLRVFDAVLSTLDELARAGPVLMVVEDLHWADRSSRDLLVFLLSRLSTQRLVVLASYRTDDLHRRHPLRPVLAELVRLPAVERLDLTPLGPAETLELVGLLADGRLPEPLLRGAARRSEGNAFFAEELVSAGSGGLPHELAELLVARVEALAPGTQRVLRIASVAGRRVRHDRLAAVTGIGNDDLEQALRDAVAHHLLVAENGADLDAAGDAYAFRHALLREAVYHGLLPGERSRLHAAYAALLTDRTAGSGPAAAGEAAELAHHALAGHDLPLALAASVSAAGEANDRAAPAEVLLHAERAIGLWRAVSDPDTVAGVDELTVTRWAAWGASASGDPDRGIAHGRRALELAEERGDPQVSSAIGRRYALRLLDLGGREQEALVAAQRALDRVAGEPPSCFRAWAHAVLARVLCRLDRFAEAAVEAEAARAVAALEPPDDLSAVGASADALVSLAVCAEYGGHPTLARERLAEATSLALRAGDLAVELRARYAAGISLLDEGRLPEAVERFAAGERRAAATGTTWSGYGLELRVAHVIARFQAGDWDEAEAAAEPAGAAVSVAVATRLSAAGLLTEVGRGRFEAVGHRLAELRDQDIIDDQVIMLVGQAGAEAALWQGRPEEAARCVQEALDALGSGQYAELAPHLSSIMLAALGVAAQVELAVAAPGPAAAAARALFSTAQDAAVRGLPRAGTLGPEGRAWLARAHAELTRVEVRPDPDAWTAVVDAFAFENGTAGDVGPAPAPCGYRQAYARLRRAEARLAAGSGPALVETDLRTALDTARRLGAGPLTDAARALAVRAGLRLEPAVRAAADPLTAREHSVLALVAAGGTNRHVGTQLFISEKTVSVHLSRVMAKLGASSRTEAVSLAYARGLLVAAGPDIG